jgi:glutaredoxin
MEERSISIKLPRINLWMVSTLILILVLVLSLTQGWSLTGRVVEKQVEKTQELSIQSAAQKALDYINTNLVPAGSRATLISSQDLGTVYQITTSFQGREIPIYISKDGRYVFLSGYDTSQPIQREPPAQQQAFDAPDKEIPEVNLFVMSWCPFGVDAERLMKPVVDLLGDKINLKVRFIVNIQGDTVDSVKSLHGKNEAVEDLRQACIMKYYGSAYWEYLMGVNEKCYPIYRNTEALEKCWKEVAEKLNFDVEKISECASSSEGIELLKADEELASQFGVTGSPTLIINGAKFRGARSSEAFKQAICSGFVTQPKECEETLSATGGSTSTGGC